MSEYSKILAEIDRYKSVADLADQQRMLVEEEVQNMVIKIKQVDAEEKREKEELYKKLVSPAAAKKPPMYKPQAQRGVEESQGYSYQSALKTSSANQMIKESIRTLPGFTEFVKNSELIEAFRESYSRDVKNYCRQSINSIPKDMGGSMANSEHMTLSDGKDKLNYLYNTFKNSKENTRKREESAKVRNHNNTIKEDIREEEEDHAYNLGHRDAMERLNGLGKSSETSRSSKDAPASRASGSKKATRKDQSREKVSLSELRPDLKESIPEDYQDGGLLQIPSDAHLNIKKGLQNSSMYGKSDIDDLASEASKSKENSWVNDKQVVKNTVNTNKTKSFREEEYVTNFGRHDSDSDDKSGFVIGTPQKQQPPRNTVTSDQSYPIKTTSKKDEVLTFRKKDSGSKLKHTFEGSSEIMEFNGQGETFFEREPNSVFADGSARTNTFLELSSKNMAYHSENVKNRHHQHNDYIYEEEYEDTSQNKSPENKNADFHDHSSLDYSRTRKFTTEENFHAQHQKPYMISQSSNDKFKLRNSKEKETLAQILTRKDTTNFATNLTPLPSANHFDNPGDKSLTMNGVGASEIVRNFGFEADDVSLIKKPSNRSGTGGTMQALHSALRDGRKVPRDRDSSMESPDMTPIIDLPTNMQDTFRKDDPFTTRNKEMIDRFDDFFKKMDITEKERWEESGNIDDTRMRFFKDSAIGYDEYLDVIGANKKTTTVIDSAEKRVPILSQQKSNSKLNDKDNSKLQQSKISYLTDFPSRINSDSQAIGLRVEAGGGQIRDTMNTIKQRDTDFDSARITTERLVHLTQSELPSDHEGFNSKSKAKDSNVANSIYPRSIQESNMKSRNTYATSKNYNYQVNEPIEDFEDEDFEEDWQPGLSQDMHAEQHDDINDDANDTYTAYDRVKDSPAMKSTINRNRFSNDQNSYYQPSEDIDEVYIDERQIMPGSMFKSNMQDASIQKRTPSCRTHNHEPSNSQLEEDEISLSMGMKNPGQIFKNKLGRNCENNRYS